MVKDQPDTGKKFHRGILPKFAPVMQTCGEAMPKSFVSLLSDLFGNLDQGMLELAEHAGSDDLRTQYQEALQELKLRRVEIEQSFYRNLLSGFENFASGKIQTSEEPTPKAKKSALTLVEKEEYDKTLVLNNVVNNACSTFLDRLFALNKRLAIVNGGTKLGEKNAAMPVGPRHLCNAFVEAVEDFDFSASISIDLIQLFEEHVVKGSGEIYDDFNNRLSRAGILSNLSYDEISSSSSAIGQNRPGMEQNPGMSQPLNAASFHQQNQQQGQPQSSGYTEFSDEAIGQQLINGISELLMRRHPPYQGQVPVGFSGVGGYAPPTEPSILNKLVAELNSLQHNAVPSFPPAAGAIYQPSMETIKSAFEEQTNKLTDIVKRDDVPTTESDIIDLVGMLFEFILDDESIPDSVKALLSHLHTPYLKIAILDRKFFVRNHHPARKLLNAMSQAGSRCSPDDPNDVNVISKIQYVVNRVLNEFEEDVELFSTLLKEFSDFMENFNRRSLLVEKRAVSAAKGRGKLQSARRVVSTVIIDRCSKQKIPKFVENIILGPWANYLVITALRHGENSPEWRSAIRITDELIWSVQPKRNDLERENLRNKLPKLVDSVRAGLELSGDIDFDMNTTLDRLANCHKMALAKKKPTKETLQESSSTPNTVPLSEDTAIPASISEIGSISAQERQERWKEVIPKEWQEDLDEELEKPEPDQEEFSGYTEILEKLKIVELGTWFEFIDITTNITRRGKLAWINQSTSNYMFVNQGGRQIAVKSLHNLAKEVHRDETKILSNEKTPFISRALTSIHKKLKKSDQHPADSRL